MPGGAPVQVAAALDLVELVVLPVVLAPLGDHRPRRPELDFDAVAARHAHVQRQYFRLAGLPGMGHRPEDLADAAQALTSCALAYSSAAGSLARAGSGHDPYAADGLLGHWVQCALDSAARLDALPAQQVAVALARHGVPAVDALAAGGVATR